MPTFLRLARPATAAAVLALLAACGSKQDRIESGLRKGAEFVQSRDWDKANVEMRNVLQIDPKNARAYLISAQTAEAQNDIQRAYGSYLKAVELKPDLLEAKVGLARMYLFAGDTDKADKNIREVLAADPAHLGARTLAAALLARRGQVDDAVRDAQAVIAGQKSVPAEASLLLAGLYANQGKPTQALEVIEQALQSEPKHQGLLQVAAQISGSAGKADPIAQKADGFFERAIAQSPKSDELWRAWAGLHIQRGELDRAEKVLRDAIAAHPDEGRRRLELVAFLNAQRGADVAEKELNAAVADKPKDMSLRFGQVDLYRANGRTADAQRVLAEIVKLDRDAPSTLNAKSQLAAYRYAGGQVSEAKRLVAEVIKASPRDNAALLLRGRMALADGQGREAVADLRSVAKDQPGSGEVVSLLARAHRLAGEPFLAREVLADAVKFKPEDPQLRLLLAADMADAKDFKAATAELDTAIKAAPKEPRLYDAKAQVALAQGDRAGAERALQDLKASHPKQAVGYIRLGQFYMDDKRYDAALKEYDAGATAAPDDLLPYMSAVGLLVTTKKFDEANARIDAHQKADPKNVLHDQLRGDVALARGDAAAAERAYRQAIANAPTFKVGYLNTARVLAQRNELAGALAVLEQGEKAIPNELALPMAKAEWLSRAKRWDDAIAIYEAVLKRAPDDEASANNLAYILAEMKGDRTSTERALTIAGRFAESRNPGYLDSLGWIHHKLGQYDKAVPLLERAVALAPASPIINLHLGQALVKFGNPAKGKEYLKRALDSKTDLPNLDEAKAMLAQG